MPKIKSVIDSIDIMRQEEIDALEGEQKGLAKELREKIDCRDEGHKFSGPLKIIFLTGPDDDETVKLDKPIFNDRKNKHGKTAPFTYGTRYVPLDSLKRSNTTTELERLMRE